MSEQLSRVQRLAGELWEDPQPVPAALPPVQTFDDRMLPEAFRGWLGDIADRMQCPPDFPAVGAMVALGAVIGRRIGVRPKRRDDWIEVPNLWGAVIGRPGIMKTPALAEALKPLQRLIAEAKAEHKAAGKDWQIELDGLRARQDAIKGKLKSVYKKDVVPLDEARAGRQAGDDLLEELRRLRDEEEAGAPKERRYMTSDTTTEKLGELLAENPAGMLVYRDELTGWLRALDKESRESDRAFYLEAWNGTGSFTFDRIGRGTIQIDAACVSILGGIQPGPLADYVAAAGRDGRGADGLLQRFQMVVYPDDPGGWQNVDRYPDTAAKNRAYAVFDRLAAPEALDPLDPTPRGGIHDNFSGTEIPALSFDEAGQEVFDAWREDLECRKLRAGEPEIIEAHLSKYRKLVPGLALILHLADGGEGPIGEVSMLKAATWGEYLETHARRVYAIAAEPDLPAAHALLAHLGELPDPFTPKQIYARHWSKLDRDGTLRAISLLAEHGWLRTERTETGGRPSTLCHVNPRIQS